jgi:hypothetical protein
MAQCSSDCQLEGIGKYLKLSSFKVVFEKNKSLNSIRHIIATKTFNLLTTVWRDLILMESLVSNIAIIIDNAVDKIFNI